MELRIKEASKKNILDLMRSAGYYFFQEQSGPSFVRPFARSGYPRFHIYYETDNKNNEILIKLHLDQKKPIYKGSSAHSGEYEGPVVEAEIERLKSIIK